MKKQRPVVPFMPWTWLPPQVFMGNVADTLGLANTPEGMPSAPLPMRVTMSLFSKFDDPELYNLGGGKSCSGGLCGSMKSLSPFNMHPANMMIGAAGVGKHGYLPPPMNFMLSMFNRGGLLS